jgi:hypothetical protein
VCIVISPEEGGVGGGGGIMKGEAGARESSRQYFSG